MRKAIVTRYRGPTNTRGSRIQVKASGVGSKLFDFSHANSIDERHAIAAKEFATRQGWHGLWVAGGMPDETGSVYCCLAGGPSSPWKHAEALANFGRVYDRPLGIEGEDWFFVEEVER